VAGYLGARTIARRLDSVTVTQARTLGQTLESIERQLFSWSWPFAPEQARAVGGEIRQWASRENVPLDAEHHVQSEIWWWAFDVR